MRERLEPQPTLESLSEKEMRFQELRERAEKLCEDFLRDFEADKNTPEILVDDDRFMEAEVAVEDAAWAALETENKGEYDRLMEKNEAMMRWRFGE